MATNGKRRLITKTYQEKYQIIKYCEANPGEKKGVTAERFDIPRTTLNDILKNKSKVIKAIEKGERPDSRKGGMKRIKHVTFEDVDSALIQWFRQMAARHEIHIESRLLLLKARGFAEQLGHEDGEKLNDSWIDRFKERWGIGKVMKAVKTEELKDILQRYEPRDVYNADESGLFWLLLPENTLGFKGLSYHGKKENKMRITILVGANMDGSDKLPMYTIGKSKKPRAFKNVRRLPVEYSANKKAWMTSVLFDAWMSKLDRKMGLEKRKICMVVDSCTAHPSYDYQNIELVFLPPNTTSHTQPMDAGIIKNLKFHYRRILAARRLTAAESEAATPFKWDLLDTLFALKTAWSRVSQATVANCFRKTGFQTTERDDDDVINVAAENEGDGEENRQFRNIWDGLQQVFGQDALPTIEEYVDVDAEEVGTQDMTDAEIVEMVKSGDTSNTDETIADDQDMESDPPPTVNAAIEALDVLKRFATSLADCPSEILDLGDKYETFLQGEIPKRLRQAAIEITLTE